MTSNENPKQVGPGEGFAMELSEDPAMNEVLARLSGRIDIFSYRNLAARLEAALAGKAGARLLVEMSGVSFVASSGWSVFVATRSRIKRSGGRMDFVGLHTDLARVYMAMKLNELVPCFATLDEARASILE